MKNLRLCDMKPNDKAVIKAVESDSPAIKRMKDMGIESGEEIICLFKSLFADPTAYRVNDVTIALRKNDCADVIVSLCEKNGGTDEGV